MKPEDVKILRHANFESPAKGGSLLIKIEIGPVIPAHEVGAIIKAAIYAGKKSVYTDEHDGPWIQEDAKEWLAKADELEKMK